MKPLPFQMLSAAAAFVVAHCHKIVVVVVAVVVVAKSDADIDYLQREAQHMFEILDGYFVVGIAMRGSLKCSLSSCHHSY